MNVPGMPAMSAADLQASVGQVVNPATWEDIRSLRSVWPGPIVVKGVLSAEDARCAVAAGAQGVIVSNHGGRQLDCAPASILMLPEIVAAVGSSIEVYLDSGVRRGWDVAKALSLGARAVFVGRPAMFGLAAGGEAGAARALTILFEEYRRTLLLMGRRSSQDLDQSCVISPGDAVRTAAFQ
jgi:isopentenyl diphosphate isomerase/L-lactate dehydrogenase-like FMN-dependent dehydrogenase